MSLYENVWKLRTRTAAAPDLVEQRTELLFGGDVHNAVSHAAHIGIPRAPAMHSLYPLYATFFPVWEWRRCCPTWIHAGI